MTEQTRSTCWSITINNPTETDLNPTLMGGWKLTGQIEEGEEGTRHYQGMLTTPQVRFSAVKKVFPRAHIEVAKNRRALEKYVHKTDTRVEVLPDRVSDIPTLFDYQQKVALRWDMIEFAQFCDKYTDEQFTKLGGRDGLAMEYLDTLVEEDIRKGVKGVEFIAINPMWRSSWKRFWEAIIFRALNIEANAAQEDHSSLSPQDAPPAQDES